ncbi:helix-turn-helix domain-containing protein [Lactococcus lactis]|uniref:Transcription regulator n=1 Tax=Lactococcus lactis subsp. lactis TaxID=1360 RepID=A0A0V8E8D9_LACLL|nr:helix-turn-helix transcriptional regulator [Lactococcus lactis]KSU22128.1 transcription regulator [Lactococcus lactis subsp. lactis]MCT0448491.1 XRE family transcriptional regulator [Lactococcus lactis subsp. lactis]MDG4959704.1 helix-turn-helix domain-containing protein [Lactococcus lactis]MDG4990985.1 helix-turn-helix domain-containing protein [Lactococcus lactis]PFG83579.1 transcriptional regulator [Lactococcus lactis]
MEDMPLFSKRLIREIKKSGKSVNCIERELGYTRNSLNNYKNGTSPSGIRLIELSNYFHVSPEYLIGKEHSKFLNSPQKFFDQLDESKKIELLKISEEWAYKNLMSTEIKEKL